MNMKNYLFLSNIMFLLIPSILLGQATSTTHTGTSGKWLTFSNRLKIDFIS